MGRKKQQNGEPIKLVPREELFCNCYARNGSTFGNATMSYAVAFDKDPDGLFMETEIDITSDKKGNDIEIKRKRIKNVCSVMSVRLLAKDHIRKRIDEILNKGIDDMIVDVELSRVIKQNTNLNAKVSAIEAYNKVHGRITTKVKHRFEGVSDEALINRLADIIAGSDGDTAGD